MEKKIVFIGIGLLVIAIVVLLLSVFLLSGGVSKDITTANTTVAAHGFSDVPITYYGNTTIIAIYAIMGNATNIYVLNASDFSAWSGHMNSTASNTSGIAYAQALGVNGTYVYSNVSNIVIPIVLKEFSKGGGHSGKAYLVIDNTLGSKSYANAVNATISYFPLNSSTLLLGDALGYGVIIAVIAAIILIVWGLFKKPKADASNPKVKEKDKNDKVYVDRLYKGIKGGKGKKDSDS
ncbi:MAG: hypothetical protein ACREBH_04405 [Candidatus Micrarchaeaceae archaeon]